MQITLKSFQRLSSNPNIPPPIGQRSVIYMITIDLQTFFKQFSNAKITVKEMEMINKLNISTNYIITFVNLHIH